MAARPGPVMGMIDLVHRWAGGLIGLLLAVMGLSGIFLLHQTAFLRWTLPHAADPIAHDDARLAAVVTALLGDPAHKVRGIRLAGEALGVHRVYYAGETAGAYVDQAGETVARWTSEWQRPEVWLFDLHHHLFAGETGTTIVGLAGLAGLAFVVTGILLWWRTRSTFAFRLVPKRLTRPAIVRHHRDLGVVMAPLLLLTFVSGAMMALKPVEAVLLAPFGDTKTPSPAGKAKKAARLPARPAKAIDWAPIIAAARARFPDGELRWIGLPGAKEPRILLRLRRPGEWTPNGRTMLWFDATGHLTDARDAVTVPARDRAKDAEYPLHTGDALPAVGRWVMTLSGLTLAMLGTLTVWTFWFARPRPAFARVAPARSRA